MKTLALVLLVFGVAAAPLQDKKAVVPDAAAIKEAEQTIRELFKEDYAKKAPADKRTLARKLLTQGKEPGNTPASQYVLLTQTIDLSTQAGDIDSAVLALNELSAVFAVDVIAQRTSVLAALGKAVKAAEDVKALAKAYLQLVDEAIKADDLDAAMKAATEAGAQARRTKDAPLITACDAKSKDVSTRKAQFEKVRKAKETLANSPDDPAANLAVGQYYCLSKGDWVAGVPLLAKSTDGPLKAAALKDAANPEAPEEQAAAADGWWDLSETALPENKAALRDRAGAWYLKAQAKLAGLPKLRVEKRVMQWNTERLARGSWIDLTDPSLFGLKGKVGDPFDAVQTNVKTLLPVNTKPFPAGDYDGFTMRIRFKMEKTSLDLMYKCTNVTGFFFVQIRGEARHVTMTGPNGPNKAPSTIVPLTLADEYVVTVTNTKEVDTVFINGVEIGSCPNPSGNIEAFNMYCHPGTTTFDKIKLRKKG